MNFQEKGSDVPLLSVASNENFGETSGGSLLMGVKRYIHSNRSPSPDNDDLELAAKVSLTKPRFQMRNSRAIMARAMLVIGIYIGASVLCFFAVLSNLEGYKTNGIVDALYFCVVTMTTVGYGDLTPSGDGAKLFTCAFVFVGFGVVSFLLGNVVDYLFDKEERLLLKAIQAREATARKGHSKVHVTPQGAATADYEDFSKMVQESKTFRKVVISGAAVISLFLLGVVVLVRVEGLRLLDAFYTVCVTVTTLGYGDKSFHTIGGRVFAVMWILGSTICLAQFFLYLAQLRMEGTRNSFMQWVLTRKVTTADLKAADIDLDGRVSRMEFILFKLKELRKIDQADIDRISEEFSKQADDSGFLIPSDLCTKQD